MNYLKWSQEYEECAQEIDKVIARLKHDRIAASPSGKQELSDKITYYRRCRAECIGIADHLRERHRGVA